MSTNKIEFKAFEFPDKGEWRLVEVNRIQLIKNTAYDTEVTFQKLDSPTSDKKNFKTGTEVVIKRKLNVALFKSLVVGSIWLEGKMIKISPFEKITIKANFIKDPIYTTLKNYFPESHIPKMYLSESDMENGNITFSDSEITVYELDKPLILKDGVLTSSNELIYEKGSYPCHYIAFIGSEISRYFISGNGVIMERLFTSDFRKKNSSKNFIFDTNLSIKTTENGVTENKVYLRKGIPKNDINIQLAGNIAYNPSYIEQITLLQKNIQGCYEKQFEGLRIPSNEISEMEVYIKRIPVDNKENQKQEWGILVFYISKCKGYINKIYSPFVLEPIKTGEMAEKGIKILQRPNNNTNNPTPKYNNNKITSPSAEEITIEDDLLSQLINQEADTEIQELKIEKFDWEDPNNSKKKLSLETEDDPDFGNPGDSGNSKGKKPKIEESFEELGYFGIFEGYINKTIQLLKNVYSLNVQFGTLNHEKTFLPAIFQKIQTDEITELEKEYSTNQKIYLLRFTINDNYSLYIFERNTDEAYLGQSRTKLFYITTGGGIDVKTLVSLLKPNTEEQDTEILEEWKIKMKRFNHQQRLKDKKGNNIFFDKDKAIHTHSLKISKFINEIVTNPPKEDKDSSKPSA